MTSSTLHDAETPLCAGTSHAVHFYEDEGCLLAVVSEFLAAGLREGPPVIALAERSRHDLLRARLHAGGFDGALLHSRLHLVDAEEMLSTIMSGAMPDAASFRANVGELILRVADPAGGGHLHVYGEMVNLLWQRGRREAALRLEELWNDLAREMSMSLLCAYSIGNYYRETHAASDFDAVCLQHDRIVSEVDSDRAATGEPESIARLRHQARTLRVEIQYRVEMQRALRDALESRRATELALRHRERELEEFLENAAVPIHWVGEDGTILFANAAELALLGYSRDEYIGRNIAEFHADADVIADLLRRLGRGEQVRDAAARLIAKDGSIKHVRIDSNVYFENGQFVHTRCFTRDVTDRHAAAEQLRLVEAKFRRLSESNIIGIVTGTIDGRILEANDAFLATIGCTGDDLARGLRWTDVTPAEHLPKSAEAIRQLRERGECTPYEKEYVRKDGSRVPVLIGSALLPGSHDTCITYVVDLSERKTAEREAALLAEAGEIVAGSLDLPSVVESTAALFVPRFADWCFVDFVNDDGTFDRIAVAASEGEDRSLIPRLKRRYPAKQTPHGVPQFVRAGETMVFNEIPDELLRSVARDELHLETTRAMKLRCFMCVPLVARGRAFGAICLAGTKGRQTFSERDKVLAVDVARRAALAIDNARLHEALQRDRDTIHLSEERWRFIGEASEILSSSLDYEATLRTLARLVVPRLADWCAIDMLQDEGDYRRLAVEHVDPAKVELAHELHRRYPPAPERNPILEVMTTQKSQLVSDVSPGLLAAYARDEEHFRIIEQLGLVSWMIVPLGARGTPLGAITLVSAESGRHFDSRDVQFAEEIARRASHAIENSRLFTQTQAANRAKDEFLATLSHELRTPMTAILGWSRFLTITEADTETVATAIDSINRAAVAQAQLIDDVLDMSRIVSGKLVLDIRPIDLGAVVNAAIETVRPAIVAKHLSLNFESDPAAGVIWADPNRIQQAIWNLLTNAAKFTDPGGSITIDLRRTSTTTSISVRDTGQGIAPDFLPFVFERFRQSDSASTRAHGGLGIGLALVRYIVEMHGGRVHARSAGPGKGSEFTIELPTMAERRLTPQHLHVPREGTELCDLKGTRVLFVDDQAEARQFVRAVLERCGAEVREGASAAEAMTVVKSWRPDVVLTDVAMPMEDGHTLARRIRALDWAPGEPPPILALTAYGKLANSSERGENLFASYLSKPIDPIALANAVKRATRDRAVRE